MLPSLSDKIKLEILSFMRFLEKNRMNLGTEGNISVRYNNGFYITPSAKNPSSMKKNHIVFKNFNEGFKKDEKPSSEWRMHQLIYDKRPEINAIVHCHSMWSSTLSCLRIKIPSFHYMVAEFGGYDVRCSKYATFGTSQLAENIVRALKGRKGCLISNHGQICVGKNLEDAIHLCLAIEKLSKQFYHCLLTDKYKLLSRKQMIESLSLFQSYKAFKH